MQENEIKEALNAQIKKIELEVENDDKTYTSTEILAMLYSIRDCE